MNRREFITLLTGAAVWPLAARAQGDRVRRIGVPQSAECWASAMKQPVRL